MIKSELFCIAMVSLLAISAANPVSAQNVQYRPSDTPLWYKTDNPFKLFWVRGTDTLGTPARNVGVERHQWSKNAGRLINVVTDYSLDTRRTVKVDTLEVSAHGRVLSIRSVGEKNERVDLLLPLPAGGNLDVGRIWTDSMRQDSIGVHGPRYYAINRRLEVKSVEVRKARKVALVEATGEILYRFDFTVDSASGAFVWTDMRGPVDEAFEFDVESGQMLKRTWNMHLRGKGGIPNPNGGVDTVSSGLDSRQDMVAIDSAEALERARPLVGSDTTVTIGQQGEILLHVTNWTSNAIISGMARNDGTVGSAKLFLDGAAPSRFESLWTSPDYPRKTISLTASKSQLIDKHGKSFSVPREIEGYAIADIGMEELMAPLIGVDPL
jgi:hypothetical protein